MVCTRPPPCLLWVGKAQGNSSPTPELEGCAAWGAWACHMEAAVDEESCGDCGSGSPVWFVDSAAIPHITQSTPSAPKCFPASSMANSSSQLVFSILGQGGHSNICTLGLGAAVCGEPWVSSWVTLTPLQRLSSATQGSVCTGKPSISCVLGKKRVSMSAHTQIVLPLLIHPSLAVLFCPVLPKMLPSASWPRWFLWHRTGGNSTKRGELQRILKECKEYSKTKGLEESEVFSKS